MRIAFCFPGQGSQAVGMGQAIAAEFPEARAVYDEASETVGFDVARLCFEGSLEDLTRTELQQPALHPAAFGPCPGGEAGSALQPMLQAGVPAETFQVHD